MSSKNNICVVVHGCVDLQFRWPGVVDFNDPSGSCELENTRNFYVDTEPERNIRVGVWHILPECYNDEEDDFGALGIKLNQLNVNVTEDIFHAKVEGIAPGQSAVFYEGNDLLGGGFIAKK